MLPLLLLLAACSTETPAPAAPAAPGSTLLPPTLAPGAAPASQGAPAMPTAPTAAGITGTVAETMDAGGYTYLRLQTSAGEKWAAVTEAKVAVGSTVTIVNAAAMHNFTSPTLKRTFDEILFGSLGSAGGAAPAMAAAPAAPAEIVVQAGIPRAEGADGRTVAEVFAQRQALAGKKVAIRGQVVKYNDHIMNKNWVHLRDGSGSAATKDNDLTVTTAQEVAVGDVVLVTGTLATDKDFGAGYAYPAIVEDAAVTK